MGECQVDREGIHGFLNIRVISIIVIKKGYYLLYTIVLFLILSLRRKVIDTSGSQKHGGFCLEDHCEILSATSQRIWSLVRTTINCIIPCKANISHQVKRFLLC